VKILIFGGDGMLGHELLQSWRGRHEVWVTLRQERAAYTRHSPLFDERTLYGIDVRRLQDVVDAAAAVRPDAVVNAVGIVKQRAMAKEATPSLEVNALFPHRLAQVCAAAGARMVHLSTDCVFSGQRGHYVESDVPDAKDLYGRSKLLGEVAEAHCLTLRTSIIGLELDRKESLVEWFLGQRGRIKGFRRAIYSGLTTREMARAIEHLLSLPAPLGGLWHLSSEPIDKYDLLTRLSRRLGRTDVEIAPDDEFFCDRSLDSSALRGKVTYRVPSWDAMLDELAESIRLREERRDPGR
jgi:dTDP-4-dehydrorhamnose reductase